MPSLAVRLFVASCVVLAVFLGLSGYALERAFRDSAEAAVRDQLQGYIFSLIAAAQIEDNGDIFMPKFIPGVPFAQEGSGIYARIDANDGRHSWRSRSMGADQNRVPPIVGLATSAQHFQLYAGHTGAPLYIYSFGVSWDQRAVGHEGYTFTVAENLDNFNRQLDHFRRRLWGWLGGVALVLLAVQGSILRWGLAPLRRAADELAEIEAGRNSELSGAYPQEMRALTDNLNVLIRTSREHLERYRNTLGDLAHSLNTPLAVLRGAVEAKSDGSNLRETVREQVDRMSDIVAHQLQRAATSGRMVLTAPVSISAVAEKIRATLAKVYGDKNVDCRIDVARTAVFHGDEGDLYELLGNITDNAFKWCQGNVAITAVVAGAKLRLTVEDDGPGIAADNVAAVTERGVRADPNINGYGIGLAVVRDIVQIYNGALTIGIGHLGGARITIELP